MSPFPPSPPYLHSLTNKALFFPPSPECNSPITTDITTPKMEAQSDLPDINGGGCVGAGVPPAEAVLPNPSAPPPVHPITNAPQARQGVMTNSYTVAEMNAIAQIRPAPPHASKVISGRTPKAPIRTNVLLPTSGIKRMNKPIKRAEPERKTTPCKASTRHIEKIDDIPSPMTAQVLIEEETHTSDTIHPLALVVNASNNPTVDDELAAIERENIKSRSLFTSLLTTNGSNGVRSNLDAPSGFTSSVVLSEVLLRRAEVASYGSPSPNPLRTAIACYTLDRITQDLAPTYRTVFGLITKELYSAVFANYGQGLASFSDTPAAPGVALKCGSHCEDVVAATEPEVAGEEAALANKYLGNVLVFESERRLQLELKKMKKLCAFFAASISKNQMVLKRSVNVWVVPQMRYCFKIWRHWVKTQRRDVWMRKRRRLRLDSSESRHNLRFSFLMWQFCTAAGKIRILSEREASLTYQIENSSNQFTLQCFKAERYLVTIDELRESLERLTHNLAKEKKKNYDAAALINVEHTNRMHQIELQAKGLAGHFCDTLSIAERFCNTIHANHTADHRIDPDTLLKLLPEDKDKEKPKEPEDDKAKEEIPTEDNKNPEDSPKNPQKPKRKPKKQVDRTLCMSPAEKVLLRWADYVVGRTGLLSGEGGKKHHAQHSADLPVYNIVTNFGSDWSNGQCFIILINSVYPALGCLSALQDTTKNRHHRVIACLVSMGVSTIPTLTQLQGGVSDIVFVLIGEIFDFYVARKGGDLAQPMKPAEHEEPVVAVAPTPSVPQEERKEGWTQLGGTLPEVSLNEIGGYVSSVGAKLVLVKEEIKVAEAKAAKWEKLQGLVKAESIGLKAARANGRPVVLVDMRELEKFAKLPKSRLKDLSVSYTVTQQMVLLPDATPIPFEKMVEECLLLLKSNFQDIQRVFSYYSNGEIEDKLEKPDDKKAKPEKSEPPSGASISMPRFWRFVADVQCVDRHCTNSIVSRIFGKVNQTEGSLASANDMDASENPDTELIPIEFSECLIRIADAKIQYEAHLHSKFEAFLQKYVLPYAAKDQAEDRFKAQIFEKNVQSVIQKHSKDLYRIFREYTEKSEAETPASETPPRGMVITVAGFCAMLDGVGLLSGALTREAVLSIFKGTQSQLASSMSDDDDKEVFAFHQVLEVFIACAVYKYPCPYTLLEKKLDTFLTTDLIAPFKPKLKSGTVK